MSLSFRKLLFLLIGFIIFITEAPAFAFTSDDFSSIALDTNLWTVINPQNDATFTMEGFGTPDSVLSIGVPGGIGHDVWSGNMAPRVMQPASNSDFEAEVKFQSLATSKYQIQGIIVEQDSNNYIRFDFVRDATGTKAFSATITNGTPKAKYNIAITSGNPLYLRVNRVGNQWTQSYSYNGTTWTVAGSFSHTLTVSKIGPFAGNAGNPVPAFISRIDYFFNTASPVSPEDGGDTTPPLITLWYGDSQSFGQIGVPQPWANILGNVSDPSGISSLSYTLNGGLSRSLTVGPDGFRVQANGDFNVDIDYADLICGTNEVVITATDNLGNTGNKTATVNLSCNNYWPASYSINWGSVTNIQDVAQVVDGHWRLDSGKLRPVVLGYDRLVAIGDIIWDDYEITVPITLNAPLDSSVPYGPLFGIVMRWIGHYDWDGLQPRHGWYPLGAMGIYDWDRNASDYRLRIIGNREDSIAEDWSGWHLSVGVPYIFKMRAETIVGKSIYSLKVWEEGTPEPSIWRIKGQGLNGELKKGSLLLITHYTDVSFGDVLVTPGPFTDDTTPPVISNIVVTPDAYSATIGWETDELSSSTIFYGQSSAYESGSIADSALVSSHAIAITGLTPNSTYHYMITSTDAYGNSVSTTDLSFTTTPRQSSIVSDDFSGPFNNSLWTVVDPRNDATFTMQGSGTSDAMLSISVPSGQSHDIWYGNFAPGIMQPANNRDFEVEVKFQSDLTSQYQVQGILVEEDSTNFIRFDFVRDVSGTNVFSAAIKNGSPALKINSTIAGGNPLYLRVKRMGNLWVQSYSYDGTNWTTAGSFTHTLAVISIGPFAANGGSPAPAFTGLIDYFFNNASPILTEDALAPVIIYQPANQSISPGETATFSVTATGIAPLSYQWQKDGVDIPGANSSSYTTPSATLSDNGAAFLCIVTNSEGIATSSPATLTVAIFPPAITTHPSSITVGAGQTATFSVAATGTAPLTYQWQKNGVDIPGANSSSYTTSSTTLSDNGSVFLCIVTNSSGTATSSPATLTVAVFPPVITTHPSGKIVGAGHTATFSITVTGTEPLTYQWQKNGVAIPGATSISYTTPPTVLADSGSSYRCIVSNSEGTATSNAATLTVTDIISDDFSSFTLNTAVWTAVNPRNDATFNLIGNGTQDALLSINIPSGLSHDVWSGNMAPRIMQTVSNTDSEVEVKFQSELTSQYQIQGIIVEQDSSNFIRFDFVKEASRVRAFAASFVNGTPTVRINVTITEGNPLYLRVKRVGNQWTQSYSLDGTNWTVAGSFSHTLTVSKIGPFAGNAGNPVPAFTCLIDYFFNTASKIVPEDISPPAINSHPASRTVIPGQTATFTINAFGMDPLYYQWQKNGVDIPGANSRSYTTPPVTIADDGAVFQCIVTNPVGSVTSNAAILTVSSIISDDFSTFALNTTLWSFINPRGDATLTMTGTNADISVPSGISHDAWTGGNFAPRLMQPAHNRDFEVEVKFESAVSGKSAVQGIMVEQDSSNYLRFDFESGDTNTRIFAANVNGSATTRINSVIGGVPGANPLYMRVKRVGNQWNLSYSFDGTNWTPAVSFSHTLTVTSVGVFAGNALNNPAFTSSFDYFFNAESPIVPEDNIAPIITAHPANKTIDEGQSATFNVSAKGLAPLSYQWQTDGVDIPGANSPSYTIPPASYVDNGTLYRSIVTNSIGSTPSNTATLTVNALAPFITVHPSDQAVGQGSSATFSVVATGKAPLTYQWQKNGVNIPGATNASYTTLPTTLADSGSFYRCTVSNSIGSLTSNAALLTVTDIVSDDFSSVSLNTLVWTVVNPRDDATFSLVGNGTQDAILSINVPSGLSHDVWSGNMAPRIMQTVSDTDAEVEVKFQSELTSQYQIQGIIVEQDSNNFIRFDFVKETTRLRAFAVSFVNGTPSIRSDVTITGGNPLYLRVKRVGDQWTQSYSYDGTNWTVAGSFSHTLIMSKIGPFAGNAGSPAPEFTCLIDYFFNTAAPLVPEDSSPPLITTHPANQSVSYSQTATFSVVAIGMAPLTYQWQKNGVDIPGADSASYTTPQAILSDDGSTYRCVITNPVGSVTSTSGRLTVRSPESDDFSSVNLNTGLWTFINPLGDATLTMTGTNAEISVPAGTSHDAWTGGNFAPRLMQPVHNRDFEIEVKFESAVSGQNAKQGIIVEQDSNNYLRFDFFSDGTSTKMFAGSITNGSGLTKSSIVMSGDPSVAPLYMRVKRAANQWTQSYSFDGISWISATPFSQTMVAASVGVSAGNAVSNPAFTASFDYFFNTASPVINEDYIAPAIYVQPSDQMVDEGQTATFTIAATGMMPLSYQWQKNGVNIAGADTATYVTAPVTYLNYDTEYSCIVTNSLGSVTSNTAKLIVNGVAPAITVQPVNQAVTEGQPVTFSVEVTGMSPLTIQWKRDGEDIPGAGSASYTISVAAMTDNGAVFSCVVTNSYGTVTSDPAALSVSEAAPVIRIQPLDQIVSNGETAAFSVEATGTAPLIYQWQKNGTDIAGANSPAYTTPPVTEADSGASYRCVVTNPVGSTTSTGVFLLVTDLPVITGHPAGQTVTEGQPAVFLAEASGAEPLTYQWQKNGVDIPGATGASYLTPPATLADNNSAFRCVVSNAAGSVASNPATLKVTNIVSDDFSSTLLNTGLWTFINPLGDATLTMTGTNAKISVPAGTSHDAWTGGNFAPRLMQPAINSDFETEVKFESAVNGKNVMQGIIVEQDSSNYLRFDFISDGINSRIYAATVISGNAASKSNLVINGVPSAVPLYMRVKRTGNQWLQSYSVDGVNWTQGASFTHIITVSSVGIFTGNNVLNPSFTASIDYFFNTASPITPEDKISPAITTHPQDEVVSDGQTATFIVATTGSSPLSYQWQKNGVNISGATGPSYTTPPLTLGDNRSSFRCVVSNSVGSVRSNIAIVTVDAVAPSITGHPAQQIITINQTATFSVTAAGSAPMSFQWQKNGVDIPGANSASYTTPPATLADNGAAFRCVVLNSTGSATSNPAQLTIADSPLVMADPSNQIVNEGQAALFIVNALGTPPLVYQWQKNGVDIPGATGTSYTTPVTTFADNGTFFRSIVTNAQGSAISNAGILTVLAAPAVITQPSGQSVMAGQQATFTVTATGTAPLSYLWQKDGVAIPGATNGSYTTPAASVADDGAVYRCVVSNAMGSTVSNGAMLSVSGAAPLVTVQPENQTVRESQAAEFSIVATGTAPLLYQWQKNGVNIPDATNATYKVDITVQSDNGAKFRSIVTNSLGSVTSSEATLSVTTGIVSNPGFESGTSPWAFYTNGTGTFKNDVTGFSSARAGHITITKAGTNVQLYQPNLALEANTQYILSFRAYSSTGRDFSVSLLKNVSPYTNYGLSNAVFDLTNTWNEYSVQFTTSGFTGTVNDGRLRFWLASYALAGDHYYIDDVVLVKASSGTPVITMQPSDMTIAMGQTATFSVEAAGMAPLSYQWLRDGVPIPGATGASYTTPSTTLSDDGAKFRCVVRNSSGNTISNEAGLYLNIAPAITLQPENRAVTEGQTALFRVEAIGTAPLSLQWQKNGVNIPGATSPSYTTPAASASDNGSVYRCVVTNSIGSVTSNAGILTISDTPPNIAVQPANQNIPDGQTATFSIVAIGTAPLYYQWQRNGEDIPGANSPSYTTGPSTLVDSGSIFRCIVTNSVGSAVSNTATLTINGVPPAITTQPIGLTVYSGQTATFTVESSGTLPLNYQWQKNGVNIEGANISSYTTPPVTLADSGASFRCVVTNTTGTAISNPAVLLVTNIISDDFSASALNTGLWTTVNPRNDALFSVTGAGTKDALLSITVPEGLSHDVWSGNMAPRIMQSANNTDFEVEVKFQSDLTSQYQIQGIIVEQDSGNFIRFDFAKDATRLRAFTASFVNGRPTVRGDVNITNGSPLYLRVKRIGNQWTQSYSLDGINWTVANSFSHSLTVNKIGPFAGNAGNPVPAFTCLIDYFFNTLSPVVPEDASLPVITSHPTGAMILPGRTATFNVSATGLGTLSYQWKKNGVDIAGATEASYTTPAAELSDDGSTFECAVTNADGTVISDTATLNVGEYPPVIVTQPSGQTVIEGQTVTFSVVVNGAPPLTYQWQKDDIDIPGADGPSYSAPPVSVSDDGANFRCVISNDFGMVASDEVSLTVIVAPSITVHPEDKTIIEGETATFSVAANGTLPLAYQWQKNGVNIPGATGPSYTTPPVAISDNEAVFQCIVTNSGGGVVSNPATLAINGIPPAISVQAVSQTVAEGQSAMFAVTAIGTFPLFYQWQRDGIDIPGANSSSYTIPETALADNGSIFRCTVTNALGTVMSNEAVLYVSMVAPIITTDPVSVLVAAGRSATFTVDAAGTEPLSYQWQRDGIDIPGANSPSYTTPPLAVSDNGSVFICTVINGAGSAVSSPAYLSVNDVVSDDFNVTALDTGMWTIVNPRNDATFAMVGTGSPDAFLSITVPSSQSHDIWSGNMAPRVMQTVSNTDTEVEVKFQSVMTAQFQVQGIIVEQDSDNFIRFDFVKETTRLRAFAASFVNGKPMIRGDVTITEGNPLYLRVKRIGDKWTQSYSYDGTNWIVAGSFSHALTVSKIGPFAGNAGNPVPAFTCLIDYFFNTAAPITQEDASPPKIITQPVDLVVATGNSAAFSVAATGSPELLYQWQLNGSDIPGANAPSLTLPPVTMADNGTTYRSIITNLFGTVTSNTVTLTVVEAPPGIVVQPESQSVIDGQTALFNIEAVGSLPVSYQWRRDGVDIPGATGPSYRTPGTVLLQDNGSRYSCLVTNAFGSVVSNEATLTVIGISPVISVQPSDHTVAEGLTATFTVVATGSMPLAYQWQRNGTDIPGATGPSYTTPVTTLSDDGTIFRCLITNPVGSATSTQATLTVWKWWNTAWSFRIPVTVGASGYERYDKPVNMPVNFTQVFSSKGQAASLDEDSIRVVEVDNQGNVLNGSVPFQFDKDPDYNAATRASGTVVFMMEGTTSANGTRRFHIYFSSAGGYSVPVSFAPLVVLTDNVRDVDQSSFKIETLSGTYYYQKMAAGFSSLIDANGNDWLSFDSTPGSAAAGEFRGIPNMVYLSDSYSSSYFHPGFTNSISTLESIGPLKVKIRSVSSDGKWESLWEVYPTHATMTLLRKDHEYWFLYEGTPGGSLEPDTDFVVRSNGAQTLASESWTGDIATNEWVYFSDPNVNRSLFVAQHEDDTVVDSYHTLGSAGANMTVFGFGRNGGAAFLSDVPKHFTIGLMEGTEYTQSSKLIFSAYKDISVTTGSPEQVSLEIPGISVHPKNKIAGEGQTALFSVTATGREPLTYQWQKNGIDIPDANSSSYVTPPVAMEDNGALYRCIIRNANGSASTVSNSAMLTVTTAPVITSHPSSMGVTEGQTAIFSVVAAGLEPLSYQWKKNGVDIPGATMASYTTPSTAPADNNSSFRCVVSNAAGSATSDSAILTVTNIVSDDFSSPLLNTGLWTFINPRGDAALTMTGTNIEISLPAGISHDAWTGGNYAPRIMQPAHNRDFEVEVKFGSQVSGKNVIQGIIVEQDSNNYLRFDFESSGTSTKVFAAGIANGSASAKVNSTIGGSPSTVPLYMRVKRAGNKWTQSYSYDGVVWTTSATFNYGLAVTSVGLFAGNAVDNPAFISSIDYFFNTASPVVPDDGIAPVITSQPVSRVATEGQTATFSIIAGGSLPLSYQWQKNSVNIPGATGASYTTPPATSADNGSNFRCIVTNQSGMVVSATAILNVTVAPVITLHPAGQTVMEGETATFTVAAAGIEPLSYQWQKDGVNIPGATGASYTTPAVSVADNGAVFHCIVTNPAGSAASNSASLILLVAPAINAGPADRIVSDGDTAAFSITATGTDPLIYQWQKNGVNITGATAPSYTTPPVSAADSGATFRCIVTNAMGSETSISATLTVSETSPVITVNPANQVVAQSQTATFSVVATGTAPLTYQWQKNGVDIPGAVSASYTTPALVSGDNGALFRCVVTNSFGTAMSSDAILTVSNGLISNSGFESGTSPWFFYTDGAGTFANNASGSGTPLAGHVYITAPGSNVQLQQVNIVLEANTKYLLSFNAYSNTGHDLTATVQKNVSPFTNYGLPNYLFNITATWKAFAVEFTTSGFTGTVNDGRLSFSFGSFDAAGDRYYIDNVVLIKVSSGPPVITTNPLNRTAGIGQTATFTVSATGAQPLSYQWFKNNVSIPGATDAAYTTPPTTLSDDGTTYRCVISNSSGSTTSDPATLSITTAPVITVHPGNQIVFKGQTATFSVEAMGPQPISYQWQKNGVDIAGATGASYTTPATVLSDNGTEYICIVSNPSGSVTSSTAVLTVKDPAAQLILLDTTYTHTADNMGFSFIDVPSQVPNNMMFPVNYAGGTLYQKLTVITKPSDKQVQYQICAFQDIYTPQTHACSSASHLKFTTMGTYTASQSMNSLFQYNVIDWSSKLLRLMFVVRDGMSNPVDNQHEFIGLWDGYPDTTLYYPMQVRYTAIIVPPGGGAPVWP